MNHGTGVAVAVADKVMHHEIAEDLVHIQNVLQVFPFTKRFQRGDEPGLVRLGDIRLGILKDVGIAVWVVVNIPQLYIIASHAKAGGVGHVPLSRTVPLRAGRWVIRRGGKGKLPGVLGKPASIFCSVIAGAFKRFHTEFPSVAPAAAEAHAVWLVQRAGISAVIPLQETVLHSFHRQIESPVLAVDGDENITAKRRVHAEGPHHLVGEIVLHVCGVLNNVVQAQLIQAVVGPAAVVVVKFQLEAVAVAVHGGDHGERGVSLSPNGSILIRLTVDNHSALGIFLVFAGLQKAVPIVHDDI